MLTLTEEDWLRVTSEVNAFIENIAVIDYGIAIQIRNAIVSELEKQILFDELLLQKEKTNEK